MKREPLIPLLLFSSVIISGCASTLATPSQPSVPPARREPTVTPALPPPLAVTLTTTKATTHYSVRGTTTSTIFEEIEANGLVEIDGKRAMGLAVANSEVKLNAREIVERRSGGWRRFETDDGPLCTCLLYTSDAADE